MDNSIVLMVQFTYRTEKFRITPKMFTSDIRRLIGDYFHINMEEFLLEIYDERLGLYIVMDDVYLDKLRHDLYITINNSLNARIRSLKQSRYNIPLDTIPSVESDTETTSPQLDHVVIWLDKHISHPKFYQQMKSYFKSIIAIDRPSLISTKTNKDIGNLIRINDNQNVNDSNLYNIADEIYTFSTIENCLNFINKISKSQRNIFVICSGHLGKEFVSKIYYSKFVHAIYILTSNILNHYEWACNYIDKINLFTHELDLLARLTRDIAAYYEKKSNDKTIKNPRHVLTYLHWTKRLLNNANFVDVDAVPEKRLQRIEKRIIELEACFNSKREYEEEEKNGINCNEV